MKKGVEKWRLTWCMSFAKVAGFRTPGLHVFVPSLTVVVKRSKVCALFESVLAVIWNTRPVQSLICSLIQSLPCSFVHSFIHSFTKLAVLFILFLSHIPIYLLMPRAYSKFFTKESTHLPLFPVLFLALFCLYSFHQRSTDTPLTPAWHLFCWERPFDRVVFWGLQVTWVCRFHLHWTPGCRSASGFQSRKAHPGSPADHDCMPRSSFQNLKEMI